MSQDSLSSFHKSGSIRIADVSTNLRYIKMESRMTDTETYVFSDLPLMPLQHKLVELRLLTLVEDMHIEQSTWYDTYVKHFPGDTRLQADSRPTCLKLTLKRSLLYKYRLDLHSIKRVIESQVLAVAVIPSPLHAATLEIVSSGVHSVRDLVAGLCVTHPSRMQQGVTLYNMVISGVTNITSSHVGVFYNGNNLRSTHSKNTDMCITCVGHNMAELMLIDGIDLTRTYSNSIRECFLYMGVHATRQVMYSYLSTAFGAKVPSAHVAIYVSSVTTLGYPVPVTGGNMLHTRSTMFKMSLPGPYKHLSEALMSNHSDTPASNTERLMMGRKVRTL